MFQRHFFAASIESLLLICVLFEPFRLVDRLLARPLTLPAPPFAPALNFPAVSAP